MFRRKSENPVGTTGVEPVPTLQTLVFATAVVSEIGEGGVERIRPAGKTAGGSTGAEIHVGANAPDVLLACGMMQRVKEVLTTDQTLKWNSNARKILNPEHAYIALTQPPLGDPHPVKLAYGKSGQRVTLRAKIFDLF